MNVCVFKGRTTGDPECKYSEESVVKSANFGLAVKRDFVIGNGPDTDFFQCVAFKNQAKFIEGYVRKGNAILVRGRMQNNNYEKDGEKRYAMQLVVDSVELCETKKTQEEFQPVAEKDHPFENQTDTNEASSDTDRNKRQKKKSK